MAAMTTLAVLVLDDARSLQAGRALGDRVFVRGARVRHLDGQVDRAVTVLGDVAAQVGAGVYRALEDEPRAARLQDVRGLVAAAVLRALVRHAPHAEGGRVVVRRLLGVAHGEDHGVHAFDREGVRTSCVRRHALFVGCGRHVAPCATIDWSGGLTPTMSILATGCAREARMGGQSVQTGARPPGKSAHSDYDLAGDSDDRRPRRPADRAARPTSRASACSSARAGSAWRVAPCRHGSTGYRSVA